MQKELQKVNDSKKRKTKSIRKTSVRFQKLSKTWFERRERWPRDPESLRELEFFLIDKANESEDIIYIQEITTKLGKSENYFRREASKDEEFKDAYGFTKEILGTRQLKGAATRKFERATIDRYLWHYLPSFVEEVNAYEDSRKIALAAEGANPGQTIIKVVNENIREESE
jgi:hypothetical protein